MSDNPPIPFQNRRDVPIIGQPCTVLAWFPTVQMVCNCEAKQPVLVVGLGPISVCPACGRGFQLLGVRQSLKTGEPPHYDINIVMPAPATAPANGDAPKPN